MKEKFYFTARSILKSNVEHQKVCKKKYLSWVHGVDRKNPSLAITVRYHSANLVMPISDPRDRIPYPHLTLLRDTYSSDQKQTAHTGSALIRTHFGHLTHYYSAKLNSCSFGQFRAYFISHFLCPRDDSQGGIKICPCLSVCLSVRPSVRHTLRYRVCVINSSHSFKWIFLKPCISVVDILKMCIWVFGGARINFDRITAFRT